MACRETKRRLALWATGDLGGNERLRLEAHLAACPACRAAADEVRETIEALRRGVEPTRVPLSTVRRIQSRCRREVRAARRRKALRWTTLAAGCLVACVLVGHLLTRPGARPAAGARSAVERWHYTLQSPIAPSQPDGVIVQGGRVYTVRNHGGTEAVVALDAETGRPLWQTGLLRAGFLAADRRRVYCVASAGGGPTLHALSAEDGRVLWRFSAPDGGPVPQATPPVPLDGERLAWTLGRTVYLVETADGTVRWRWTSGEEPSLSVAAKAADGLLVAGCKHLRLLEAETGRVRWRKPIEPSLSPRLRPLLAVAAGRAFVAGADGDGEGGRVFCFDPVGGRTVWTRPVATPLHLTATADLVLLRSRGVLALAAASGDLVWSHPAEGCSPVTVAADLVHFVDSGRGGRLVALDRRTGRPAWQVPGLRSCWAVASADGTDFVKTWNGVLYALAVRSP